MEFRVVSLPPTMSSARLPTNSISGISHVCSLCAIIEMRSSFGGAFARSLHSPLKTSAMRRSSVTSIASSG